MEKEIKLAKQDECTGCGACYDVCPTSSITFSLHGLHYYPSINNDTCIACGKCMRVCPILQWENKKIIKNKFTPQYYCAWNNNESERFNSTSGGVGGALAKFALNHGWYVCGASFNNEFELFHVLSNNYSVLDKIQGSKYLQSNTKGVYRDILKLLSNGEKVLFFGTPCQADGLRNVIPSNYLDSLITCEIICHGVNSPIVWKDYKNYIENNKGSKIISYNFRSKSKGWGKLRVSYEFADGKKVDVPAYKNIFHSWFGQHYMMRESCFKCKYRKEERYSDIIIGDFWGINIIDPTINANKGVSVLICNSSKAQKILSRTPMQLKVIETSKAISVLKGYVDKIPENEKEQHIKRMKNFEKEYQYKTFDYLVNVSYPRTSLFKRNIKSILFHLHLIK